MTKKNLCEGCPVDDERCPCEHDYKRCNWKATFKETGLWDNEDVKVVGLKPKKGEQKI